MKGRSHQLPPLYLTEVTFNREERNYSCISERMEEVYLLILKYVLKKGGGGIKEDSY